MKRTFLLFLCLFMILSFGCTDNKLEEKPRKTISMPDTTSHPVSLQVEKKENVLNVLYPYLTYQNEYVKVFDQISALCQKELGLSVNLLTPDSSRLSVVNPGDKILLTRTEMYIYTIKSLMDAGIGPDIFFTTCMVDEVSRHNFKRQQSGFSNDLMTLIHYNYATELSPYINDKTPYLKKYRANMSNLDSLTEYKGGVYGILAPPDYKVLPVFVIRRDYNSRLDNQNHNTLHNAIDACIELNKKNVVTVHDRIVFDAKIVLSKIISDCGYYKAFISARNMYYFHKNDLLFKLHRIDDTPILDSIKKYKELFEQGSIFTSKDEKKEMVAGLMSYYSFLMSGLELAEYDIFFLEDIHVDYRSLDNIFVVSNTCINKQGATQFIDFLISDPEANFLLKYGLENLTYEIDSELGVVCTNSGYSSVSAVGGYTTGYDFLIAEYFLCDNRQEELTRQAIQNVFVAPFYDLTVNSMANMDNRTVLDALDDQCWTQKDPTNPSIAMGDWMIGNDILTNGSILPYIFEERSNQYKYSFDEIVERIINTRDDDLINSMQEIIDDYLLGRNPDR